MRAQTALPAVANDTASLPANDGQVFDLFKRWLDLSELERRAFVALTRELTESSSLVETSALDLSERFQALATIAQDQMTQVDTIVTIAQSIRVNGEAVPLESAMASVEHVLRRFIETILTVSKHAMRMVYALDDVVRDVEDAGRCVGQIDTINTQTRYLALNAAIEANRAGDAGGCFGVIAHELKDLSLATEQTSLDVQTRIAAITQGVRNGHKVLQEIATLDLSEHIMAKERLDLLIEGIIAQNAEFNAVLTTTAASSADMAGTVGHLITGMQFQDRTKQHLDHVIAVLGVLGEASLSAQDATVAAFPGRFVPGAIDAGWLSRIVDGQTLGAVKQRIMAQMLNADDAVQDDSDGTAPAGDDIELF